MFSNRCQYVAIAFLTILIPVAASAETRNLSPALVQTAPIGSSPVPPHRAPKILVVVDYERHLALVPAGTVLPSGLEVSSCVDGRPTAGSCEPLVFSYGPELVFTAIRAFSERLLGEGVAWSPVPGAGNDRPAATPAAMHPCPDDVLVEFGPAPPNEFFHLVTCDPGSSNWKDFAWWLYYDDVDEADHKFKVLYGGVWQTSDTTQCDPSDDSNCNSWYSVNGSYITQVQDIGRIKRGTTYYNTISFGGW